jgi:hypothetical protein
MPGFYLPPPRLLLDLVLLYSSCALRWRDSIRAMSVRDGIPSLSALLFYAWPEIGPMSGRQK